MKKTSRCSPVRVFAGYWCRSTDGSATSGHSIVLNYGHNNEIYGNLVIYLRIKSIVPASSEPRTQQPQPQR
jgi:hypothetical protein